MAELPGRERAIIEARKLAGYALDPGHPRGRHKARVFRAALGIGPAEADWLRDAILAGLAGAEAVVDGADSHGTRHRVDLALRRGTRSAVVRTVWIVREVGAAPRLVTCYVL